MTLVRLDKATNLLADASCPDNNYTAAFLDGTQPTNTCDAAGNDQRNIFQKLFGIGHEPQGSPQQPPPPGAPAPGTQTQQQQRQLQPTPGVPATQQQAEQEQQQPPSQQQEGKKPGFFGRIFGHKPKQDQQQQQPQDNPQQ